MNIVEIPLSAIIPPSWNANEMTGEMKNHLRHSIQRFGLVVPLVVRSTGPNSYETVGGTQRLTIAKELGLNTVPCVLVEADDVEARLLSQALNRIAGSDNLGMRAEVLRKVMETTSEAEVLVLLPETPESLKAFASLGKDSITEALEKFQRAQSAKLYHYVFQVNSDQQKVIDEAFAKILPQVKQVKADSPNPRSAALYLLCKWFLEQGGKQ